MASVPGSPRAAPEAWVCPWNASLGLKDDDNKGEVGRAAPRPPPLEEPLCPGAGPAWAQWPRPARPAHARPPPGPTHALPRAGRGGRATGRAGPAAASVFPPCIYFLHTRGHGLRLSAEALKSKLLLLGSPEALTAGPVPPAGAQRGASRAQPPPLWGPQREAPWEARPGGVPSLMAPRV